MKLLEVTEAAFFGMFPPETRHIKINGEVVASLGREVICDYCNGDVFSKETPVGFLVGEDIPEAQYSAAICHKCGIRLIQKGTCNDPRK